MLASVDHVLHFASDSNEHLTSAQKELLLWHWRLGVSMHRVQELMREIPMEDPAGVQSEAAQVIKPRLHGARGFCSKITKILPFPNTPR